MIIGSVVRRGMSRLTSVLALTAALVAVGLPSAAPARAANLANADVFYTRSTDGGTSFGTIFDLSDDAVNTDLISHVSASGGAVHVAWDKGTQADLPQQREVYYRSSSDAGASFAAPVDVSANNGDSSESDLWSSGGSNVNVVWEEDRLLPDALNPDPCCPGDEAYARRSANGGGSFGTSINISDSSAEHNRDPDISANADGSVTGIVYENLGGQTGFSRSTNGGATWSSPVPVGPGDEPSIDVEGSTVHALIRGCGGLCYNRSTNGGTSWGTAGPLVGANGMAAIAALGTTVNGFGCSGSSGPIQFHSTDGGSSFGSPTTVASVGGCSKITVDASGSSLYLVWDNGAGGDVFFARSTDSGASWGTPINVSSNVGTSKEPSVAVDPSNGNVYITWYDDTAPAPPPLPIGGGPPPPPPPGGDTTPPAIPAATPLGGLYNADQSVTLTTDDPTATIRFTTNGLTPTASSTAFTGPIPITVTTTLKAIARDPAGNQSPVMTQVYTIDKVPPAIPTPSPSAGLYNSNQSVTLTTDDPTATIRFTTDGSTPTLASAIWASPIPISSDTTVKAFARDPAGNNSLVGSYLFAIDKVPPSKPAATPAGGFFNTDQSVTLTATDDRPGVTIRYTLDGSAPTISSASYSGPITIGAPSGAVRATTLKAMARDAAGNLGPLLSESYTIDKDPPLMPSFNPGPGLYVTAQMVAITSASSDTKDILYTLDGSTPNASSLPVLNGGSVEVSCRVCTKTLKAVARDFAGNLSPVRSGDYMIVVPVVIP